MNDTSTTRPPVDGRQTAGRKGFAYDWRRVLLESVDVVDTARIDDEDLYALMASTPA